MSVRFGRLVDTGIIAQGPSAIITPTNSHTSGLLGEANSLYADSNFLLVGDSGWDSPGSNDGFSYIYNTSGTSLLTTKERSTSSGTGAQSGYSFAANSSYIAIGERVGDAGAAGAGQVSIYDASTYTLIDTLSGPITGTDSRGDAIVAPTSTHAYGTSIALSANYLVIGDPDYQSNGCIHIYNASTRAWIATSRPPLNQYSSEIVPTSVGRFAERVMIDETYSRIIVSCPGAYSTSGGTFRGGAVYVYNLATGAYLGYLQTNAFSNGERYFSTSMGMSATHWFFSIDAYTGAAGAIHAYPRNTYLTHINANQYLDPPITINCPVLDPVLVTTNSSDSLGHMAMNDNYIAATFTDASPAYEGYYGYVFVYDATTYEYVALFRSDLQVSIEAFGENIAINDSNQIFVSAGDYSGANQGAIYRFDI